jgi:lysophospholipase L1-like esterase
MNNRILIFGDSITWGAKDSEGGWAARLKKHTDNQVVGGKEDYDTIYLLGISGDNTDDLLKRLKDELISRVDEDSNMVVMIAIGINDSQFDISNKENRIPIDIFKENLNNILRIANRHAERTVFVGLTPVDDSLLHPMPWKPTHGYSNAHVNKYDGIIRKVAKENKKPFINLYEHFLKRDYKKLLSDGLHPNPKGHKVIYEKIFAELKALKLLE